MSPRSAAETRSLDMPPAAESAPPFWPRVLLLAAAYYVAARIGVLLAIPPGYATVVWPPSGIAMAGVLLYGGPMSLAAFLGSFALNLPRGLADGSRGTLTGILVSATCVSFGAQLQAALGGYLVRRYVGFPRPFGQLRSILLALLLAGPVGCLVSATIGVTTLVAFGKIPFSQLSVNWLTWWGGDTIGVLIVMPLMQVLASEQRTGRTWRMTLVGASLAVAVVGTVFAHLHSREAERQRLEQMFHREASAFQHLMNERMQIAMQPLYGSAAAFQLKPDITREDFARIAAQFEIGQPQISAMAWNRSVKGTERATFESAMRRGGFPDYQITERGPDGRFVRAAEREEYCVVHYTEPMQESARVLLGFDMLSEPVRREASLRARDTGRATTSGELRMVRYPDEPGLMAAIPVYRTIAPPADLEDRRRTWSGNVLVGIRLLPVILEARADSEFQGNGYLLEDVTESASPRPLCGDLQGPPAAARTGSGDPAPYRATLGISGRIWRLTCWPSAEYLDQRRSLVPWGVLATGLVMTTALGIVLLVVTGRTALVEELVTQQVGEIQEARRSAVAASEAKSIFLANMSHEIRTPLNAILGMTELVLDSPLSDENRKLVSTVHTSGEHLLTIINDLLDFSKIEAGKLQLVTEEFSIEECLRKTVDILQVPADEKRLSLQVRVAADVPPYVHGDESRLRQILLNLIGNAIKFTPAGRIAIEVAVQARAFSVLTLHFSVADTGIGIPAGQLTSIFSPFEQGDGSTTRKYGGTGLGLSIVRRLAEMMNGRVWVDSEVGRGSAFHVTVVLEGSSRAAGTAPEALDPPARGVLLPSLSVLVAEDNVQNQLVVRHLLERAGHRVTIVDDGQAAVTHGARGTFDLILMDMQMPRQNGEQAAVAIREQERTTRQVRTPIIALTANVLEEDRAGCAAAGMDGYLAKPISRAALFAEMARVWSGRGLSQESAIPTTFPAPFAGVSPVPAAPVALRREEVMRQVDNSLELLNDLIHSLTAHSPPLIAQLQEAAGHGEPERIRALAHRLRGSASLFGENPLLRTLAGIESAARGTPAVCDREGIARIPGEYSDLLDQLQIVLTEQETACLQLHTRGPAVATADRRPV